MAQKTTEKPAAVEADYSARELIAAARSKFGVSPDIMAAALKTAALPAPPKPKQRSWLKILQRRRSSNHGRNLYHRRNQNPPRYLPPL